MMGINLPMNFERPFFSISLADFWRRWHMSLGAWMREYVFYPVMLCRPVSNLSKKMRKKYGTYAGKLVPSVAAPMVVFFLIGIWHGITSQYIVNGLYNALLISGSVAMIPVYKKLIEKLHINTETFSYKLFQIFRTTILLFISRIIVKAPSLKDAGLMIKALFTSIDLDFLFGLDGKIYKYGVSEKEMGIIIFSILILLVVGILQENGVKIRETLAKQNIFFRWALVLLLIAFILIFGVYGPNYNASDFIYGRF
jgi:D-alanyl-lipoteichoic acid acyltransferase DltB (MBOAT superfamily)